MVIVVVDVVVVIVVVDVVVVIVVVDVVVRLEPTLSLLDFQTSKMKTNSAKFSSTSSKACLPATLLPFLTFSGTF